MCGRHRVEHRELRLDAAGVARLVEAPRISRSGTAWALAAFRNAMNSAVTAASSGAMISSARPVSWWACSPPERMIAWRRRMSATFDAIVIGSGFGGAITACRLAEKGMKVLVLERGPTVGGERLSAQARRCLAVQPPGAGTAQRLARSAVLQEHGGHAGRGRRRRVARLQQRRARSQPGAVCQRTGPPRSPTPS